MIKDIDKDTAYQQAMTKFVPYLLLPTPLITLARACSVLSCIFHGQPDGQ